MRQELPARIDRYRNTRRQNRALHPVVESIESRILQTLAPLTITPSSGIEIDLGTDGNPEYTSDPSDFGRQRLR
jgi:hypothetical protein